MGLTVYTGGTFDLFHAGHVNFLRECSKYGDVTVALNTDEFIEAYKGKPPVMSYEERAEVLFACRYVHDVIPNFDGADSKPAIEWVQPDLIIVGSDWAVRDYYKQMSFTQTWLDERRIGLMYLPYTQGVSSTDIKARINRR